MSLGSASNVPRTRLSPTLIRFWQFMLTYGLAMVLVSVTHGALFGWWVGLVALLVMLAVWWGILSFGQAWFVPYWVEDWVVEPVRLEPVRLEPDRAELALRQLGGDGDWALLDRQTEELVTRGFVPLHDYRRVHPDGSRRLGQWQILARCFAHPDLGCYAEIGFRVLLVGAPTQVVGQNSPPPVVVQQDAVNLLYIVFCSCFEADWRVIDTNRAPHRHESLIYAWRDSQEVRHYYPALGLAMLFDRHLENRSKLLLQRPLSPAQPVNWETYCALQRELITQPWRRLRQRNLLSAMLEATRFEQRPLDDWLPR